MHGRWSFLHFEDDHLLLGHFPHRPRDAADAVTGLAAAGERHPVRAEGCVVIDHYSRGGETFGRVKRVP